MKLQKRWLRVGSTVLVLAATAMLPLLPVAPWVAAGVAQTVDARKVEADRLLQQGFQQYQVSLFESALQSWQQALKIYREIKDRQGEGSALGLLAAVYPSLSNYAKAVEYGQQALVIARELKDRGIESETLNNLGNAYRYLGNYAKSIEYAQQSLVIAREIKYLKLEGATLSNLVVVYGILGNYIAAIEHAQQSLVIARKLKNRESEWIILGNLGNVFQLLGNYAKAIEYQENSLVLARELKNRQGEGSALLNLGIAYEYLGNYAKAVEYAQQSLVIARKLKNLQMEGAALGSLGNTYGAMGNYPKAIGYGQQRLVIARSIQDHEGEGTALNNVGLALLKSSHLVEAEKILMEGIHVWEFLRAQLGSNDPNKVSLFEEQAKTYRTLQQVLIAQNKPTTALEISERGRARAFVELLIQRLTPDSKTDASNFLSASSAPPSVAQMQQLAKAQNATLVEYSIIRDDFKIDGKQEGREAALYIWVISPTGAVTFRQADLKPLWQQQNTSLAQLVTASRQGIGVRGRSDILVTVNIDPATQSTRLQQLHKLLIDPIADLLPPAAQPNRLAQRVIFIPQGALFLAPFPALQAPNGQYLIEKYTPLTAPSIQVLTLTHQQKQTLPPSTATLVAGDPTMPRITVPGADALLSLTKLPGAEQEAIEVAKTLNTPALTGNQATKRAIVQQMPSARIIHLATHGLLDDFKGLGVPGAIALAPDGTGQPNDGLLTADDILDLKLKADLVVLSACNTGQGKLTGDGVIGLSRSFISAGVPSVLVSLWAVPDAPTASLMTEFYTNWKQRKLDKAEALRQAMLTTRQTHPNPRDWAAFTLIGEAE